ncbi:MAG TPA: WhiB family transcriptional regulator [Candidatus Saccharimonadales bacterium]
MTESAQDKSPTAEPLLTLERSWVEAIDGFVHDGTVSAKLEELEKPNSPPQSAIRQYLGWLSVRVIGGRRRDPQKDDRLLNLLDRVKPPPIKRPEKKPTASKKGPTRIPITLSELDWQEKARCRGLKSMYFFPPELDDRGGEPIRESKPKRDNREAAAKAICAQCDLKERCLEFALEKNEDHGIWGGTTESERRELRRQRAKAAD